MTENEHDIWLAALLHDIGKFWERTSQLAPPKTVYHEARYSHEPFSAYFVDVYGKEWTKDPSTLRSMVLRHHAPLNRDEILISLADRLSSGERSEVDEDEEGAKGKSSSLIRAILSCVEGANKSSTLYQPLSPLNLSRETLFPQRDITCSKETYDSLWHRFEQELQNFHSYSDSTLLALLHKYTWSIPSDTSYNNIPDISLYSHLKTTAAIAMCLLRENYDHEETQGTLDALTSNFLGKQLTSAYESLLNRPIAVLIKGDISGTQDFLYLLSSHGAAKGLKGRSFYLQLLSEAIANWILKKLDIPNTNILYVGGGHFYILAPYTQSKTMWEDINRQLADKIWMAHQGDLSIITGAVPVKIIDFMNDGKGGHAFADKWQSVSMTIEKRKRRKWKDLGHSAMMDAFFTPTQVGTTAQDTCQICHNSTDTRDDNGIRKCRRCSSFETLGQELRDARKLVLFQIPEKNINMGGDWNHILNAFGVSAHFFHSKDDIPPTPKDATLATVFTLDNTDFIGEETLRDYTWNDFPVDYDFRLLADATPRNRYGDVADFTQLANSSDGVKWLGVLRMDVDSLGELFREKLKDRATISRMSTLSESLKLFFEGWVPELCRKYNTQATGGKDRVYLLYAGGDDLFVVGAWSVLPNLAWDIRENLRKYAGGDHITLSAGIAIEHQKYPLYQLAYEAKNALDSHAKEFQRPNSEHNKDAICFMGDAIGWESFKEISEWKQALFDMVRSNGNSKSLPKAFLVALSEIYAMYDNNRSLQRKIRREGGFTKEHLDELIQYASWQWMMVYKLRNYRKMHTKIEELENIIRNPDHGLINHLHILARWTTLLTREE